MNMFKKLIQYFQTRRLKRNASIMYDLRYNPRPETTVWTMMGPITYEGSEKIGKPKI